MGRVIYFPFGPPAIVAEADPFDLNRCRCPLCLRLDARYPVEGFQLALFPYRMSTKSRITGR